MSSRKYETLQGVIINYKDYSWKLFESKSKVDYKPSVDNCFYIDFPNSSVLLEWTDWMRSRRIPFQIYCGTLKHNKKGRVNVRKIWCLTSCPHDLDEQKPEEEKDIGLKIPVEFNVA